PARPEFPLNRAQSPLCWRHTTSRSRATEVHMRGSALKLASLRALAVAAIIAGSRSSFASLTLGSGLGTTHAGNLVTNGSFENGAPADGTSNWTYWATGTSHTPLLVPPGRASSRA